MLPTSLIHRLLLALLALVVAQAGAQGSASENQFYRAYYLETALGDTAAACKLYAEVAAAPGLKPELAKQVAARLAACREDLASVDLARLMPPEPLAYFELSRPGQRVRLLLDQLGLLAGGDRPGAAGKNRLAVSPALVDAALGLRGLAAAVTGFDPARQEPTGVLVFHPGDMNVVRGLIETAVPAGGQPAGSIGGFATYRLEDRVLVTLTSRLVVASTLEGEIESVIDRLKDPDEPSLAGNPALQEIRQDRQDPLLFFFVNPRPLMPLLTGLLAAGAAQSHELAMAQALLDLKSFRSLTGCLDAGPEGLRLELSLRLEPGHRNLVFNFLRGPALDPASLRAVPSEAAGFLALALNTAAPERERAAGTPEDASAPIVTALDLGRELFANINGLAIFLLPAEGAAPAGHVPPVGAAITVNDPARSRALWTQVLGLASLASGAATMQGQTVELEGVPVESYRFGDDITVYLAIRDHHLLIGSTQETLARTLRALRAGPSVLDDAALAKLTSQIGPHTTLALVAHAGRCAALAGRYMSPSEAAELAPMAELLTDTVAGLLVTHSDQLLRLAVQVRGVPDVSGLVSQALTEQHARHASRGQLDRSIRQKDWDTALRAIQEARAQRPDDAKLLRTNFDVLAAKGDAAAARPLAEEYVRRIENDARQLNNFAWELLTEARYGQAYDDLARQVARRANELTGQTVWAYLDTLALAEFRGGDVERAIALQQQALKLAEQAGGAGAAELKAALARFETARQ